MSRAPINLGEACRRLFADESRAARCLEMFASGELDVAGLLVAPGGAILVQALPSGLGLAWPPRAESVEAEDALVVAACGWLQRRGAKACQAFAEVHEVEAFAPLLRHGFRHVTQFIQMRREAGSQPPGAARLEFTAHRDTFARTQLATFAGTLDCPELNSVRAADHIPISALGLVAWHAGEAVGVVALDGGELAYLGVVPTSRGRGFGDELLRHAIGATDGTLQLSVDARNAPARRLYARHGFVEVARREAFLAVWDAR